MKVSDICKIVEECNKLRNILIQDERALTGHEIQLCDMLGLFLFRKINGFFNERSVILMTKKQFSTLAVGDEVYLNGRCRMDAGTKCKVTYICDDRIWVKPVEGALKAKCLGDRNEISYKAANVV